MSSLIIGKPSFKKPDNIPDYTKEHLDVNKQGNVFITTEGEPKSYKQIVKLINKRR